MSIFETMSLVEDQYAKIERAQAVLLEATHYFERNVTPNSNEAYYLIMQAGHISLLLHVVNDLLYDIKPKLEKAANELFELHEEGCKQS